MTITYYDALMLLTVIVAVLQGAWRGMVWQIAPIASLVLGYVVAYPMSAKTAHYFGQPPTNRLFAMITIYLAVSLAVYLMVRSVRESLERLKLIEFDKHLGALLGGVKGILFTVVLTIGLLSVSPQARAIILPSETRTIAARIMGAISPILPPALTDRIGPYVEKLHEEPLGITRPEPTVDEELPLFIPSKSTARRDTVVKPRQFNDDDGFAPFPAEDEQPFGVPDNSRRQPAPRSSTRTPAVDLDAPLPATTEPDDFFNADPDRALSSPSSRIR